MKRRALLLASLAAISAACAPKARPSTPTASVVLAASTPAAPPIEGRDPNRVGEYYVVARSFASGSMFHGWPVGGDVVLLDGARAAVVRNGVLEERPDFMAGIAGGPRSVLAMVGSSVDDAWLLAQRGTGQGVVGELFRKTGPTWTKVRDVGTAPWTFETTPNSFERRLSLEEEAMVVPWRDGSFLALAHARDDRPAAAAPPPRRFEVFAGAASAKAPSAFPATPKSCVAAVYPRALAALPSGEIFVAGERCRATGETMAVARWDAAGKVTLDPLTPPHGAAVVSGALARSPTEVFVFGHTTESKTGSAEDQVSRAWLSRWDGKQWTNERAPDAPRIDKLLVAPSGAVYALAWPDLFERGSEGGWTKRAGDPELARVRDTDAWLDASGELWITGALDGDSGRSVVLRRGAAPEKIWQTRD